MVYNMEQEQPSEPETSEELMTERLSRVPAQVTSPEEFMTRLERLMNGHVDPDTNRRYPGVIERLEVIEARQAKRDAWNQALSIGIVLSGIGMFWTWMKDHIGFH